MNEYLKPLVNFLKNDPEVEEESDFICLQYDIVDKLEADKVGFEITKDVVALMEQNPSIEFGTPGPLTHFIEKFYSEHQEEYNTLLENSVKETPAIHTISLLTRVINASEEKRAVELTEIISAISENNTLHKDLREVAQNFLEYRNNN